MRHIRIGKIVLTDGGEWNASSAYTKLTWVLHNDDAWWSTVNNIDSEPSDSNPAWVRATSVQKFIQAIQTAIADADNLAKEIEKAEQLRQNAENLRVSNEKQRIEDFAEFLQQCASQYSEAEADRDTAFEEAEAERISEWTTLKQNAVAATTSADTAASNANSKATLAENAAALAVEKAGIAQTATTNADEKAAYAKEKGDYAKEQGDAAVAIINENVGKINGIEASIEGVLNILEEQGHVHAQTLDIDALPTICTFPLFRIEEKDPDVTPDFIGQFWINKTGNTVYIATHCNSAAGFKSI